MITLTTNQPMLNNSSYLVCNGGNYNETDLVEVCHIDNQNLPIASYQAFYILNGYDYLSEESTPKNFKIGYDNPTIIDYDILGFHKKRTITFGELRKVEYFKSYVNGVYSDLVVEETRDYFRDSNGLVSYRNLSSKWYLTDDSIGLIKNSVKYYSLTEAIDEGITRRGNVIAQTKSFVLTTIGQLYSFDLLTDVKSQIDLYISGYTQPLRDAINASVKPYLNSEIKANIIENLRME